MKKFKRGLVVCVGAVGMAIALPLIFGLAIAIGLTPKVHEVT